LYILNKVSAVYLFSVAYEIHGTVHKKVSLLKCVFCGNFYFMLMQQCMLVMTQFSHISLCTVGRRILDKLRLRSY